MNLPIYELKINDSLQDDSEVSYVALVDLPAIKKDFLAFKQDFIEPSKGEHETDFLPRCIKYVIDEGKETEQAVAICKSIWAEHFAEETYNDYPEAASENAKTALRWAEKNGWGGDEGIAWASRKLEQINKFAGGISFDFDGVLTTSAGIKKLDEAVARGTNVYIVSARHDDKGLKDFAQKHGVKLSNVFATGSNKAKVEKVKSLAVSKHIDNNSDVIKELGSIGEKFQFIGFQVISEDEHIISGPLMLAEELIYRNNEKFGEHYVKFSADTIKAIAIKFSKKAYQSNVNLMHDPNQKVDGVTMFESFLTDKKRGIMPMAGYEDVADGSWFGSFYVENPEVWNAIKSGEYRGFSVEGLFDYEEPISHEMMLLKRIENLLNEIN